MVGGLWKLSKIKLAFKGSHLGGQPPAHCHGCFIFHPKISWKMLKFLALEI